MLLKQLVALISLELIAAQSISHSKSVLLNETCVAVPSLFISNRTQELECCEVIVKNLYETWSGQGAYLSRTLATLKAWNCPQFDVACSKRYLGFTEYTSLVYDRFCNESRLIEKCQSVVSQALTTTSVSTNKTERNWTSLVVQLNPNLLTSENLMEPCFQIALMNSHKTNLNNYHEIIIYSIPFCRIVWAGFDYKSIERESLTIRNCLPARCKLNIIISVLVITMLAIAVTIANFTVILVYATEKKMRHSQGIFRLSFGIADIIVGFIVLPTTVNTILKTYHRTLLLQTPLDIRGQQRFVLENSTYSYSNANSTLNMLETNSMASSRIFSLAYSNSIGFFTSVSLIVSIYLLTFSGIDRLRALTKPLLYRQDIAKRFAVRSSSVCWLLGIFFSVLPTFVNDIFYAITGSIFSTLAGRIALFIYLIEVVLPLIATWVISIAMFLITRKIFNRVKTRTTDNTNFKQQRKLNFILSMMVASFSLSLLPTLLVIIFVLLFFPNINAKVPKSFDADNSMISNSLEFTAALLLTSNSLWNCLIYSLRSKSFRTVAVKKYKTIWRKVSCYKLVSNTKRKFSGSRAPSTTRTILSAQKQDVSVFDSDVTKKLNEKNDLQLS